MINEEQDVADDLESKSPVIELTGLNSAVFKTVTPEEKIKPYTQTFKIFSTEASFCQASEAAPNELSKESSFQQNGDFTG